VTASISNVKSPFSGATLNREPTHPARSKVLMVALDSISGRFGRLTLKPGGMVGTRAWSMRPGNLSPSYTTRIEDVLQASS